MKSSWVPFTAAGLAIGVLVSIAVSATEGIALGLEAGGLLLPGRQIAAVEPQSGWLVRLIGAALLLALLLAVRRIQSPAFWLTAGLAMALWSFWSVTAFPQISPATTPDERMEAWWLTDYLAAGSSLGLSLLALGALACGIASARARRKQPVATERKSAVSHSAET